VKHKILLILVSLILLVGMLGIPVQAATQTEIDDAIQDGLAWLVAQQQQDGSWSPVYEPTALTSFALVKLCDRAYETGYDPFEPDYTYSENVTKGFEYLFKQASDTGVNICFDKGSHHENYATSIAMMAIAASRKPGAEVNVGNIAIDGMTYKEVLQGCVYYMEWTQCSAPWAQRGGWSYGGPGPSWADQSNTGYSVLGLRYAEAEVYEFECLVPLVVRDEHMFWVNFIQRPDGGADYDGNWNQSNLLRTGNLLFEQSFVDIPVGDLRVQAAIGYIQNNWDPEPDSQTMYCLMKGFQSYGIDEIIVGGNLVDWYDVFADFIIANQHPDGYWDGLGWGRELDTVFCLLVLEKVSPPPPVNVEVDVLEKCVCDNDDYQVNVTYTVERFIVNGKLRIYKDGDLVDTVILTDFTGTETYGHSEPPDMPGTHIWRAWLKVSVPGGAGAQAEDEDTIDVCETPDVGDIPDQTAPFGVFDLDDYLSYGGLLPVSWSVSGVPIDWTVEIDVENVVTVTPPVGAGDPVVLTFTASVACPCGIICSDSDDATFIPNLPPDCSEAYADSACLWPPNHKFVDISVMGVTDPDGDPVTITITAITSDEPTASDLGSGGEKHAPDASGIGTDTASVRAERSGTSDGRVYMIHFTASDGRGGECEGSVMVKVPHDQSSEDCTTIDSGQDYDATQIN